MDFETFSNACHNAKLAESNDQRLESVFEVTGGNVRRAAKLLSASYADGEFEGTNELFLEK